MRSNIKSFSSRIKTRSCLLCMECNAVWSVLDCRELLVCVDTQPLNIKIQKQMRWFFMMCYKASNDNEQTTDWLGFIFP